MNRHSIAINGMSCRHCVQSVRKELLKLAGVKIIDVQIGKAVIEYNEGTVTNEMVTQAITDAGYMFLVMT